MRLQNRRLLKLGERITSWRRRRRRQMTIEELSTKMSISKGNLSDIEAGKKDPRYSTLLAISEGLGITISTLLREL
ncbi:MAG: helix-turn-helix domain-containing protein [Bdellovibrionales bacterium]